jgi:hypothetical protein
VCFELLLTPFALLLAVSAVWWFIHTRLRSCQRSCLVAARKAPSIRCRERPDQEMIPDLEVMPEDIAEVRLGFKGSRLVLRVFLVAFRLLALC